MKLNSRSNLWSPKLMARTVRISPAEVVRAKIDAENAGLRLTSIEKRPDGTMKYGFSDHVEKEDNERWFRDSPLYRPAE